MTQDWKEQLRSASGQAGAPGNPPFQARRGEPSEKNPERPRPTGPGSQMSHPQQDEKYFQTLGNGYMDEDKHIREEFIVEYAKYIADNLEAGGMTRSLLRNFYSEVADIKHLLREGRPFPALRPRILKLQAFAANAANRRTNRAPPLFQRFITENVRIASRDPDSFLDGFCQHFECVVLYFKGRR